MATAIEFAAGQTAGKFHILREIGRGGMGVVYLAEDVSLGRRVAIKILHGALQTQTEHYERFKQEARACATLCHPNIARIHSLDEIDGQLIIEMEYLEGGSLADHMYARGVALRQALQVTRDILLALERCHEAGIVHRDIKPSNILFDRDGRALLTDFGLARAMDFQFEKQRFSATSSFVFLGTPRYAPPEAWENAAYSPAWDIYSLGMVLYEAASGRSPYDAETPLAFLKQLSTRQVRPLSEVVDGVSAELSALVASMLAHDPDSRPRSAGEALTALAAAPECAETTSESPTLSARTPFHGLPWHRRVWDKWRERRRAVRQVTVWCIFALVAALIYVEWPVGAPVAAPQPERRLQNDALRRGLIPSDQLLTLWKSPTPKDIQVFDTYDLQSAKLLPRSMMLVRNAKTNTISITLARERGLWRITGSPQSDLGVTLQGFWADYADPKARQHRHGIVGGLGAWTAQNGSLTLNMRLQSDDGTGQPYTITASPAPGATDTQFVYDLEESDYLLPLLYNELVGTGQPWAEDVERLFPCMASSRVVVPRVTGLANTMQADGRLDEPAWNKPYFISPEGRAGVLAGTPLSVQPELRVIYDNSGVYLGITANDPGEKHYRLDLTLSPLLSVPTDQSRRYHVAFSRGTVVDSRLMYMQREAPWTYDWKIAEGESGGVWSAEIAIPFSSVALGTSPRIGSVWRFNLSLFVAGDDVNVQPVARWGYSDPDHIAHGATLVFGAAAEDRSVPIVDDK